MPTVLITGANRGIGLEFAKQYRRDGWKVIATARMPEAATELAAIEGIQVLPLDVIDPVSVQSFVDDLAGEPIDLLIHNAGVYGPKAGIVTHDEWLAVFEANTLAPYFLTQALLDNVRAGTGKTIATLTSKMGSMADNTSGGAYIYRSSKAAVNAVMKSFAEDLKPEGIKVALLHPGWVQTDMGGQNALINTETSVSGMRWVLEGLKADQTGGFFAYDGQSVPW